MNILTKPMMVLGLAGAMAMTAATPSMARNNGGAIAAGAVVGLAAGAIIGSAAANANNGYYAYGYAPEYGYDSGGYAAPAYGYGYYDNYYNNNFRERQIKGLDW